MKKKFVRMASSLALCALTACGGGSGSQVGNVGTASAADTVTADSKPASGTAANLVTAAAADTGITRIVYFLPQDETLHPEYQQAMATAALTAQSWYAEQLGGRSFRLAAPVVEVCRGAQPAAWYSTESWTRVYAAISACNAGFRYDDPASHWVVYAQVRHQCGAPGSPGAALRGVAILPVQDLQGVAGEDGIVDDCGAPVPFKGAAGVNRWIGGLAHEIGHTLGLPHPAGCEAGSAECDKDALMWTGYSAYPNTYLSAAERQQLQLQGSTFLFSAAAR